MAPLIICTVSNKVHYILIASMCDSIKKCTVDNSADDVKYRYGGAYVLAKTPKCSVWVHLVKKHEVFTCSSVHA